MMGELLRLREALFKSKNVDPKTIYQRKLDIIQKNLYGVDKDEFAVNIAMLRLWLSLAVTADLYVYFYRRGTELLRTSGILTYISSNKFLRAAYGKKL